MPSRTSKAAIKAAGILRYKRWSNNLQEAMMDIFQKNPLSKKYRKIEKRLRRFPSKISGQRISYPLLAGRKCGYFSPQKNKKMVLFLHGGSFLMGPTQHSWVFLQKICQLSKWGGLMPDYPKAPEWDSQRTLDYMDRLFRELYKTHNPQDIVLIGSSAGGGLALTSLLRLKDQGLPLPARQILISPWLDLSMTYQDTTHLEHRDITLSRPTLLRAAQLYSRKQSLLDPQHSPLQADLSKIPPTMLLTGTEELFVKDCRQLNQSVKDQGGKILYIEKSGLFHSWPIFHMLPESEDIRPLIAQFIQGEYTIQDTLEDNFHYHKDQYTRGNSSQQVV
ncbi:MAG: alpha/beta hydrolase [Spirochaetaceae bacterium]|nr:alpha/beta hydrolase [Spirochaetaceae bacterium]